MDLPPMPDFLTGAQLKPMLRAFKNLNFMSDFAPDEPLEGGVLSHRDSILLYFQTQTDL
jgi:hypothetical protein